MTLTVSEKCTAAEELIAKGKFEDAEFLLDQVLESHPSETRALVGKSALRLKSGDVQKAKSFLKLASEKNPSDAIVETNLANVALLEKRVDDALAHLAAAHDEKPDYLPAILLLAQIHHQSGNSQEAATWLNKATDVAPGDANVLVTGASLLLANQKISEAKASFERALEFDPEHVRGLVGLAQLHCLLGEFNYAAELAKKAHLLSPQDPESAVTLAQVYLATGALAEAQKLIDRFSARLTDYAPVVLVGAEIAIARGQTAQALADAAKWLRKAPTDKARITAFLKLLKMAGAWQKLLDMCSNMAEETAKDDGIQSLREEALHALGRGDEAWQSWADRRNLPEKAPSPPLTIELPERTPILDELVLMRFVNAWAEHAPLELHAQSPVDGLWDRLASAASIHRAHDQQAHGAERGELLADLVARTCLHAPGVAAFKPYLKPDQARCAEWSAALPADHGPLVGVFWEETAPGLLIDHLKEAISDTGVVPVSLQFDRARHQLRSWPEAIDAGVALTGPEDLVNVVNCLDLVVGPDGLPIHIAGALGRKAVVILQENHEWYWAGNGSESIWYPSVKRFITPAGPAWEGATSALAAEIDTLLS